MWQAGILYDLKRGITQFDFFYLIAGKNQIFSFHYTVFSFQFKIVIKSICAVIFHIMEECLGPYKFWGLFVK